MRTQICSHCFAPGHTRKFCPHLLSEKARASTPAASSTSGPQDEIARLKKINQTLRELAKEYLDVFARVDRKNGIDSSKDLVFLKNYVDSLR